MVASVQRRSRSLYARGRVAETLYALALDIVGESDLSADDRELVGRCVTEPVTEASRNGHRCVDRRLAVAFRNGPARVRPPIVTGGGSRLVGRGAPRRRPRWTDHLIVRRLSIGLSRGLARPLRRRAGQVVVRGSAGPVGPDQAVPAAKARPRQRMSRAARSEPPPCPRSSLRDAREVPMVGLREYGCDGLRLRRQR